MLKSFKLSARAFSEALGEKPTITQNYVGTRNSMPGADYLEKILKHFDSINPAWLMTGQGEPFLPPSDESQTEETQVAKNFSHSQVAGKMKGNASQQQHVGTTPEPQEMQVKLALAEKEIEHLQAQLASANALIASKDDFITLLRASYNRPN